MIDFIGLSEAQFADLDEAEFVKLPEDKRPSVPSRPSLAACPIGLLTNGGELRGASFGNLWEIDDLLLGTTNTPRMRYPAVLQLLSPYRNADIRYTLNGRLPTIASDLYVGPMTFGPVEIEQKWTVLARIFDKANSNVQSKIVRLEFRVLGRS